jgi:hypothetical protein
MSEQTYAAIGDFVQALRYKKAGAMRPWDEKDDPKYYRGLVKHWDTDLLRAVTGRVEFHEEWRPDAARLYALAAEIASPLPCEGTLWEEFLFRCSVLEPARYEQRSAHRWAKILLQEPWSHPALAMIAREMGGMSFLRGLSLETETARGVAAWKDRFHFAYERVVTEWRSAVIDDLRRPQADRDPTRFTLYPAWKGARFAERTTETVTPAHMDAVLRNMQHIRRDLQAKVAQIGNGPAVETSEQAVSVASD